MGLCDLAPMYFSNTSSFAPFHLALLSLGLVLISISRHLHLLILLLRAFFLLICTWHFPLPHLFCWLMGHLLRETFHYHSNWNIYCTFPSLRVYLYIIWLPCKNVNTVRARILHISPLHFSTRDNVWNLKDTQLLIWQKIRKIYIELTK